MQRFTPSLLDRLFDASPETRQETVRLTLSLEQLKDCVARDVEALLNCRCALSPDALAGLREVQTSIVRFGLDDFSPRSLASVADRDFICRSIERALADHEPRLRGTRVHLDVRDGGVGSGVRFLIQAMLHVYPSDEPVSFDAVLQTGNQQYTVASSGRAVSLSR
jgi:type VI secretion system protein ImpF